jgi:hypothetical protein
MFPGKKGFERLVSASKNALSAPVTWLFCELAGAGRGLFPGHIGVLADST